MAAKMSPFFLQGLGLLKTRLTVATYESSAYRAFASGYIDLGATRAKIPPVVKQQKCRHKDCDSGESDDAKRDTGKVEQFVQVNS